MDGDKFSPLDYIAWGLFSKTGNIGYYFLYNDVKKRRKNDKDKKKQYGNYSKRPCFKGGRL